MPSAAMFFGLALIVLGALGYLASAAQSWTALIPAMLGFPLVLLGALASKASLRKYAMHAAALLTLVGLLGSARGVPQLAALISGDEVARPAAAVAQSIMAALCLVFVILCVKSFVDARRKRALAALARRTHPEGGG